MLRGIAEGSGDHFVFGVDDTTHIGASSAISTDAIAIDNGPGGLSAIIPDAHFLFTAQFARSGADLVLHDEHSKTYIVHDYFASDERPRLLSPDGAALSGDVVTALAGPLAPGQYAQGAAATAPAHIEAVGRVAAAAGDATIVRNGVAIAAHAGDAVHKGDVLQTVSGEFGVTFNDGSTLNLTANSRLVVNEFVYSPNSANNSQLLNLVQGSLTFVSGEVAHTGSMKIGTPVATMGIRGTVGGVTTANDGTVHFYVSQSATGAVILDSHGAVIANVVQDGPMIVVRPAGPLQVIADEIQKSPAQLAIELQALQQIMSIKAIGDQYLKQALQPDQDPHPGSHHPYTQFSIDLHLNPAQDLNNGDIHNVDAPFQEPVSATVTVPNPDGSTTSHDIQLPPNKPPVVFGPQPQTVAEDHPLVFGHDHENAISVFDEGVLKVTLTASHGLLTLKGFAGLTFSAGDGTGDTTMTFSGTAAAINAALDGMSFTPDHDYNGPAQIKLTATDDAAHSVSETIGIGVAPVNDAPQVTAVTSTGGLFNTGLTEVAAGYLVAGHDLVNGLGGAAGFGENHLASNDDGSTSAIDVTSVFGQSGLNFFGHAYTSLYINNNGNITFGGPSGDYTPDAIVAGSQPIIAPFWADVDTRGGPTDPGTSGNSTGSNLVYYDLDSINHVMTITWDDVGYYSEHTGLGNAFQLQLIGTGDGNFDIVMRYESINWTTGDASGGSGGLGGTAARAGYTAGDGNPDHYYELPQSGDQSAMLGLDSTNGDSGIPGVDVFQVESGNVSGAGTANGKIAFTDADASDTHTASLHLDGAGYVGTFALENITEANGAGSVAWHFNLTNEETNSVAAQGAATQSYDITIFDNHNAAATQTVSLSFGSQQADTFHFNSETHLGADTLLNFDAGADTIVLEGYDAIATHDQLIAALSSNGADAAHGDAVINLGHGDSITVAGVTQDYLQQHLDQIVHLGTNV